MRRLIVNRGDDCSTKKDYSWFMAIEKHAVITEVGGFGDPQFDKTRCLQITKKLLYLLNHGETFTQSEAAALLSSAVNLYRFQDVHLRRMFHLIARDLCPIANEVPLVTSLLLKDVDTDNVAYRANVIRLLCHITNDTSLSQVLKCLKEARCDGNPMVENASFVCAINMLKRDPRMAIKLDQVYPRPTVFRTGKHIQFHSIYLDYVMGPVRRQECIIMKVDCVDDLYMDERLVQMCPISGHSFWSSSPLGACILARGITQDTQALSPLDKFTTDRYIQLCINDKDEMVAIEGFRSLGRLIGISITQLKDGIDVMHRILCFSDRPVSRFSAFRALHKVGIVHNVAWITPEDHIAIGLDANLYKLYMEKVNHRDNEPDAEQVTQVIKSQALAVKEVVLVH